MSWGLIHVTAVDQTDLHDALNAALHAYEDHEAENDRDLTVEVKEAAAAAIDSAVQLAMSGAVGPGPFTVSLSGHANPDHQPVAGWANDFVAISVTSAAKTGAPAPTA